MTTALSTLTDARQALEYVLFRVITQLGARAEKWPDLADAGVRGEGWLPTEAVLALKSAVGRRAVQVTAVRGKSQGETSFNPDIELRVGDEYHQVAFVPVLVSADQSLAAQIQGRYAREFQWLTDLKERAAIYLLAFPIEHPVSAAQSQEWTDGLAAAQAKSVKLVEKAEFIVPRPPRRAMRVIGGLFVHSSRFPEPAAPAPKPSAAAAPGGGRGRR